MKINAQPTQKINLTKEGTNKREINVLEKRKNM